MARIGETTEGDVKKYQQDGRRFRWVQSWTLPHGILDKVARALGVQQSNKLCFVAQRSIES